MKKLNNKGFTVVELVVSFIFVFTMAFAMYELLYNYRVKQNEESIKAQLVDYKNQVTLAIQNDIYDKKLKTIDYCTYGNTVKDKCIVLNFNDNTSKQLAVEEGTRLIDGEEYPITYIVYGNLIYESPDAPLLEFRTDYMLYNTHESDQFEEPNVNVYKISIPIYHNDLKGNYGISIVAVGYNYKYDEIGNDEQGGSITAPDDLNKNDGREYNGYITGTSYVVREKQKEQTIVARVRFNESGHQHILSNMQLGGSSLTVGDVVNKNSGKLCYNAYVETNDKFSQKYQKICHTSAITTGNNFYIVVGRFDSVSKTMAIFVNGNKTSLTLPDNSFISPSTIDYSIGGNSGGSLGVNSYYLKGLVSQVLVYDKAINDAAIMDCLKTSINTTCLASYKTLDDSTIPNPVVNEKYSKN